MSAGSFCISASSRTIDLAAGVVDACRDGGGLPEISPELDHADVIRIPFVKVFQYGTAFILRAVIHEEDLPRTGKRFDRGEDGVEQERQVLLFVIDGDDYGNIHFGFSSTNFSG